jgi:hypothetical protein
LEHRGGGRTVGPRCDAAEGWGRAASGPGQSPVGRDSVEPGTFAVRDRVNGAGAAAPYRVLGPEDNGLDRVRHGWYSMLPGHREPSARLCSAGRSSETPARAGFGPAPSCPPAAARSARRWGVPPACGQPCLQKGRSIMQANFTFRRLFVGSECPRRSWRGAPRNRSGMPSRLERSLDSCAFHDEPRPPGSARVECPVVPRWNRSKTVVRVWQDPTRPQGTRQRLRAWPASDG